MRITRREFIGSLSAAVTAGSVLRAAAGGENADNLEWRNKQPTMKYRRLGRTNFMVSEIGIGGAYINMETLRMVEFALERGVNYIDTSSGYARGQSEPALGELMKRKRDKVFLTTKVALYLKERSALLRAKFDALPEREKQRYRERARQNLLERGVKLDGLPRGRLNALINGEIDDILDTEGTTDADRKNYAKKIIESVEGSLSRLKTDCVDIIVIPGRACTAYQANLPEVHEAFEKLRKQGKARFLGITTHSNIRRTMLAAIENGRYDMVMPAYNAVNHDELDDVLKMAFERDVGVVAMKAAGWVAKNPPEELASGEGSIHQRAYAWVLRNRHVSCVIAAAKSQREVEENIAVPFIKLGRSERRDFERYARSSRSCRMCGRCVEACPLHLPVSDVVRSWIYLDRYGDAESAADAFPALSELCLRCGRCERACPERVPIRRIVADVKARLFSRRA